MLIDAAELEDGALVESDVTVAGAGPAGIVVALELAAAGLDVVLAESGTTRFHPAIQRLGDTEHYDRRRHAPMSESTRRQIGGASVIWGGRCVPYDPIDFDERGWVPHSGWPVGYAELEPYFGRACEYFLCGRPEFDLSRIPGVRQASIVPGLPDGDVITSALERWSLPTDFGREYRSRLRGSEHVRLIHGLTVTRIECGESGRRVAAFVARTLGGKTLRLRSRAYVVACGGVETTRLLLASDRPHTGGIGNHAGHLGRFYMGHISGRIAQVRFSTPPEKTVYGFDRDADGVYLRRRFAFAPDFQRRERLHNLVAYLANPSIGDASHRNGILSFSYLALASPLGRFLAPEAIRQARIRGGDAAWKHLRNVVLDPWRTLAFIPSFGYRRYLARRKAPGFYLRSASNVYDLHYHGEQVPNPDSRISLADDTDELGLPRVRLELRYSPQDVDSVVRAHEHWDRYLRRHGVGCLEYVDDDPASSVWEQASDGFHQVGTTRMSSDPGDGVVDVDCGVHGFDDLYVASSSVFVTSSQANSTFMIVVFALRLAEHLKHRTDE